MKKLGLILAIMLSAAAFAGEPASTTDELGQLRTRVKQSTASLKDLKATVHVNQSNRRELEKMGKVFAETYQFKKADVCFMSPDKLKMNGQLGMMKVEFITSGNMRLVRVPSMRFKKQEDIANEQLKQITSLDVGVVTDRMWDLYKVKLLRTENTENGKAYVLLLSADQSKKTQMIWVEDDGLKLLRRDRLLDDGKLKVKTVYSGHKQFEGVWVPVKAEVYNGDGKLAAVTETKNIAVNAGVDDKEFQ